jgi:hypothetical protein
MSAATLVLVMVIGEYFLIKTLRTGSPSVLISEVTLVEAPALGSVPVAQKAISPTPLPQLSINEVERINQDWYLHYNPEYRISFEYPPTMTMSTIFLTDPLDELRKLSTGNLRCTRIAFLSTNDLGYTKARGPGLEITACINRAHDDRVENTHPEYVTDLRRGEYDYNYSYFPQTNSRRLLFYRGEFEYGISLYGEEFDAQRIWGVIDTIRFY